MLTGNVTIFLEIGGMHPLFLRAMGGLTYYAPPNFSQKFSQPTAIAPTQRNKLEELAERSEAEIMEITLDNGRPGVLCCYQEDYHRRLDRPEGTWKRVIVPHLYRLDCYCQPRREPPQTP